MEDPIIKFELGDRTYVFYLPDRQDNLQRVIRETGAFDELEILADMLLRLAPGDLVIDCGANIGNHSIFLAGAAQATVIAIEPYRHLYEILDRNIALNELDDRILPLNSALGAERGTGTVVYGSSVNLGRTRIETPPNGMGPEIAVIPLDALELTAPVKLIKIDVEGMEADVLRGAAGILERDAPFVYAEAHDETALDDMTRAVEPFGYVATTRFEAAPVYLFEKNPS